MRHKGVAKRKQGQKQAKALPVETASGSISALLRTTVSQPAKSQGTGGVMPFSKVGAAPSPRGKKKSNQG